MARPDAFEYPGDAAIVESRVDRIVGVFSTPTVGQMQPDAQSPFRFRETGRRRIPPQRGHQWAVRAGRQTEIHVRLVPGRIMTGKGHPLDPAIQAAATGEPNRQIGNRAAACRPAPGRDA
ncbi:hypothetical protein [Aestuariicoccus sp. MJ-SS9]|uniref:hypothetical protein n=1 Tax=Aestuariicoccus sp. MJ-SS9 TaxID=3079855 RepID=UPI00291257A9|nr:hypothetical protein [Aestuariicoccus sp. MJ-SS9]MDU8913050.1 hypothetical protein [Aestuariicoccus sp. MJ-SS9]